jgi:hypothetical protein
MSYRIAQGEPNMFKIVGFGLEMQKVWPLEVFGLIVPKKNHQTFFFYLCSSNGNPINKHLCIDKCHKSTQSPNNLMFKLIMFIEKIKHLYSKVEIKTLKIVKTMFGYQTLKLC